MKLFDKILLGVLSAASLLAGVILAVCALDWGFHMQSLGNGGALFFVILAAVLVLVSVRMFFVAFKKEKPAAGILVQTTEMGASYMTFGAVEGVVRRQMAMRPEVKGCKVTVSMAAEDKLAIGLRLTILPDTPVASLASQVQQSIKGYLESICGVKVAEIAVLVESASVDSGTPKAIAAPRVK